MSEARGEFIKAKLMELLALSRHEGERAALLRYLLSMAWRKRSKSIGVSGARVTQAIQPAGAAAQAEGLCRATGAEVVLLPPRAL